jgi:hypothetical protein
MKNTPKNIFNYEFEKYLKRNLQDLDSIDLLVKFIKVTKTQYHFRKFKLSPNKESGFGVKKLVIPISKKNFSAFKKYLCVENALFQLYTPEKDQLMIMHQGKIGTNAILKNEMFYPEYKKCFMPMIALRKTEASRASNYFKLAKVENSLARIPWKISNFCGTGGGYENCAQWLANMPLGDQLVNRYIFPGAIDKHATNPFAKKTLKGVIAPLKSYKSIKSKHAKLCKTVWLNNGSSPMQLWELLNDKQGQVSGDWTNAGHISYRLLGHTNNSRVPVVFIFTASHQVKPKYFNLKIRTW